MLLTQEFLELELQSLTIHGEVIYYFLRLIKVFDELQIYVVHQLQQIQDQEILPFLETKNEFQL